MKESPLWSKIHRPLGWFSHPSPCCCLALWILIEVTEFYFLQFCAQNIRPKVWKVLFPQISMFRWFSMQWRSCVILPHRNPLLFTLAHRRLTIDSTSSFTFISYCLLLKHSAPTKAPILQKQSREMDSVHCLFFILESVCLSSVLSLTWHRVYGILTSKCSTAFLVWK